MITYDEYDPRLPSILDMIAFLYIFNLITIFLFSRPFLICQVKLSSRSKITLTTHQIKYRRLKIVFQAWKTLFKAGLMFNCGR